MYPAEWSHETPNEVQPPCQLPCALQEHMFGFGFIMIEALILFRLKIIEDLVPSCGISIRLKCSSHSDTFAQSPFLDLSLPRG